MGTIGRIYRHHFRETRRERLFLASVSFFLAFAAARLVAHGIRAGIGPFHNLAFRGTHVHHLVWGILLLVAVGYCWLIQLGTGLDRSPAAIARLLSALYGVGCALTLDEFALWLRLQDVYWERQGRASIDAVALFGALVSVGLWGGPFVGALAREAVRVFRRR